MRVTVRPADDILKRFGNQLGALGEGLAKRALSDGLNKAGDLGRTQAKRALVRVTGIKYGQVNAGVATIRSKPGTLAYELRARGEETNLNLFAAQQRQKGVSARPWNIRRIFPHTFLIRKYGNKVFRRVGEASDRTYGKLQDHNLATGKNTRSGKKGFARFPIRPVFGPNLARELAKGEPRQAFQAVAFHLPEQIGKQIARHLKA